LGRDLAAEADQWKLCDDPLTPVERREYLSDLLDAVTGLGPPATCWRVRRRMAKEGARGEV
jgi:hypothetical protein